MSENTDPAEPSPSPPNLPTEIILPASDDAEKGVLSCLIQSPATLLASAAKDIPPDAFYSAGNRTLYEQLLAMSAKRGAGSISIVTLTSHLTDAKLLDKVGGAFAIAELLSFIPTPAHYPHYRDILLNKLRSRQIIIASSAITDTVLANQHCFDEAKPDITDKLTTIRMALADPSSELTFAQQLEEWVEGWDAQSRGERSVFMPTPWRRWNDDIGGLPAGYHVISGKSSSGKSTLVSNILRHAALDLGRPCLFASHEMSVPSCIGRIVADVADVDSDFVFRPDVVAVPDGIHRKIADAIKRIKRSDLRVIHYPRMRASQLAVIAEEMHAKHGDLVMAVDYIQLLPPEKSLPKGANREREVAYNSDILRSTAKSLGIPMLVLSQLNKEGTVRDSQVVQQDADIHVRVDRWKDPDTDSIIDKGLWVDKNRNGRAGFRMDIKLDGTRFRFEDRTFAIPAPSHE